MPTTTDLDKRLAIAERNIESLAKMEKKIDDIHGVLYRNGMSAKVNAMWDMRKWLLGIVSAILVAVILNYLSRPDITKQISDTNQRIENLAKQVEKLHGSD